MTIAIGIIGGLAVFLYGMHVMSGALQRVAGARMRAILKRATDNRVMGVVTGFSVTSIIQSSSATTVMMVGFVSAGLLTLQQATGIIMGANIGTTITGWLVSLLGFKVKIAAFALPAVAVGFFARFLKRERLTTWGEVLVGFGLLFLGLSFLKDALPNIHDSPELAEWLRRYSADSYLSTLAVIGVGTAITVVVQSSSAVMAVTLTAAANGLIDFPTAAALVLGENIGTTITALLASIGAKRNALRAATIHVMFNVFGVLWVSALMAPVLAGVDWLMPGDPAEAANIPNHLALFHTCFNVTNTLIALPFAHRLAALAQRLVPDRPATPSKPRLRQLTVEPSFIAIPSLAIANARNEVEKMFRSAIGMMDDTIRVVTATEEDLDELSERIKKGDSRIDTREQRINDFLVDLGRQRVSRRLSEEINLTTQIARDLERVGGRCRIMAKMARRRHKKNLEFSAESLEELTHTGQLTRSLLHLVATANRIRDPGLEVKAGELRKTLRKQIKSARRGHADRVNEGTEQLAASMLAQDMLANFETVSDHGVRLAGLINARTE